MDDLDEDYAAEDYDDTVVDDEEDDYVDFVFKYDSDKIHSVLQEYFTNPNCTETIVRLPRFHFFDASSI